MSTQKTAEEIAQRVERLRNSVAYYDELEADVVCLLDAHDAQKQEAERLRATVAYIAAWKLYDEDQRQKTDDMAGAYETAITLCRAALAPQPTEAQEPTLEQLEREYREACVRNNFGPSAECSARWEELQAVREAVDAARKEAGEKP